MSEQYVKANGVRLAYDSFGDKGNPPLILIMGLGTQMIAWPDELCTGLAQQGFYVVRFDNRDIGLSEKMENAHIPKASRLMLLSKLRLPMRVPYTLNDMARDVIGLMDSLGLSRAHIVGASMGGMIGQIVAALFPDRILSFTSIMSSSGDRNLPGARQDIVMDMAKRAMGMETVTMEGTIALWRKIGSPDYQPSDEELAARITRSLERSNYPEGYSRHLAAIIANGSRVELLKKITAPTLVIHGKDDALVPVECGIDTAKHIRGSTLEVIVGMGHDLPVELVPTFVKLISEHALAAQQRVTAA
ncbi:MAG: alpha/beta hydrolase [Halioglobus sp.]